MKTKFLTFNSKIGFPFFIKGSQIDFEKRRFREFVSIFGLKLGEWENYPIIGYVSVFKTNVSQTIYGRSSQASFKETMFFVNLFPKESQKKPITFLKTYDKDVAFKVAKSLQENLKIDILDSTEKDKKWL